MSSADGTKATLTLKIAPCAQANSRAASESVRTLSACNPSSRSDAALDVAIYLGLFSYGRLYESLDESCTRTSERSTLSEPP